MTTTLDLQPGILAAYPDIFTPEALSALEALAPLNLPRANGCPYCTAQATA
jgi:hypothetical protein